MIVVTGGAGFIGSNIIKSLNNSGIREIIIVDNMSNGKKMHNIADLDVLDYFDKDDFIERIRSNNMPYKIKAIFHMGATSATSEWDGKFLMKNNFEYSKDLLEYCDKNKIQFIYASSASVYGLGLRGFKEERNFELPINMYAYSKFQFDQFVRSKKIETQVVGLRYFNVYGPRECHKGSMASTAYHFSQQIATTGICKLFKGIDGFADGEQKRDFVSVFDCAKINLWFLRNSDKSGIFNVGTGVAHNFKDVAAAVINWFDKKKSITGKIDYIDFPDSLRGAYQNFTQADVTALRNIGYSSDFLSLEAGIFQYLDWLYSDHL